MKGLSTMRDRDDYSIAEVKDLTGLTGRTVRYYVSQGLIPPAHGRGPSATYNRSHILRLNAIRRLKAEGLPLEEIKQRLNGLTDRQIASTYESEIRSTGESWRRIELHPDIELHVRNRPLPEAHEVEATVRWILDTVRPMVEQIKKPSSGSRS
jgi:DNA-binding transcriptional MerR regulator